MVSNVLLVWTGALLIILGVVFSASRSVWRGRLSGVKRSQSGAPTDTLEPPRNTGGFSLRENWPGLGLILVGTCLLLASAVI